MCSIEGCENPKVARGWCATHWNRWSQHGDPSATKPIQLHRAIDHEDGTRTCSKCEVRQPLDRFDRVKTAALGRRSNCKACRSSEMRKRYEANRDAIVADARQRRIENAEAIRERDRLRNTRPARRERHAQRSALRRGILANVHTDRGVTRTNLRKQYGDDCHYCGTRMDFARRSKGDPFAPTLATLDHVVPIARGGSHTWDNVVLACWRCNCSKRDRTLNEWLSASALIVPS